MHIASMPLPYSHRHAPAPAALGRSAAAATSTPTADTAAAAPTLQTQSSPHGDGPRRSALYQALVAALSDMAATTATPASTTPTETAPPVGSADAPAPGSDSSAAPAPDLDSAVMDFAHALMQAMHRFGRAEHQHHDHGRRAWGEPAQRIGQLGAQIGAPLPVDAGAAPAAVDAVAETAPSAPVVAVATSSTPAAAPPGLMSRQGRLLDAFGTLAAALGLPAATDSAALRSQLGSFLQGLAERLRSSSGAAPLQPGALLNVSA